MAVCNEYLRAWPVPAESHLELENKARIAFFCKSRVNGRYRADAEVANDAKHLFNTVKGCSGNSRGYDDR